MADPVLNMATRSYSRPSAGIYTCTWATIKRFKISTPVLSPRRFLQWVFSLDECAL